jgi:hypothetical protein
MWVLFAVVVFVLAILEHLKDGTAVSWWWLVLTAIAFVTALAISGCEPSPEAIALAKGQKASFSIEACQTFCAPYSWRFTPETYRSREHGCTCFESVNE